MRRMGSQRGVEWDAEGGRDGMGKWTQSAMCSPVWNTRADGQTAHHLSGPPPDQLDNTDLEDVDPDEEVHFTATAVGDLVILSSQMNDYLYRGEQLENSCLWDFIAATQKVPLTFRRNDGMNKTMALNVIMTTKAPRWQCHGHLGGQANPRLGLEPSMKNVLMGSGLHDTEWCRTSYLKDDLFIPHQLLLVITGNWTKIQLIMVAYD
ncbi:hypothetical protein C8Q76DRAFT_690331 [Earliella scabrosa]|nr:hypothetical protein C8Q76DRAFT_690331 [Earliella scabrosa]